MRHTSRLPAPLPILALALLSLAVSACGGGPTDTGPSENLESVLRPSTLTFDALGQTAQLELVVFDAGGAEVYRVDVTGVSSDPEVVTVDGAGVVTAVGEGSATISTTAAEVSNEVGVTVEQVVTDVSLEGGDRTILVGESFHFGFVAVDANGHDVGNAAGTWSSSDPSVATVDEGGTVTGVAEGTTTIRLESDDGPADEATVTVEGS